MTLPFWKVTFRIKLQSKIHVFFWHRFGTSFFSFVQDCMPKGFKIGPRFGPAGPKKAPQIGQVAPRGSQKHPGRSLFGVPPPPCTSKGHLRLPKASPRAFGYRFSMDSASIFYDSWPHQDLLLKTLARFRHRLLHRFHKTPRAAKNQ